MGSGGRGRQGLRRGVGRSRFVEIGGTIRAQKPYFVERGFPIDGMFDGTINVDISPRTFERLRAAATLEGVRWNQNFPAETFSFYDLVLVHAGRQWSALLYFPHPETKKAFNEGFQGYSMMEILSPHVEGLAYGDKVSILAASGSLKFSG